MCTQYEKGCREKMKRVKIRKVCKWSMVATIIIGVLFIFVSVWANRQFRVLQNATDQYIVCEQAAADLQDGSTNLTEQVRLYAMTGRTEYMSRYFQEADSGRRESAVESLRQDFEGTQTFTALENALSYSKELMSTEYYAMRLISEAKNVDKVIWPDEITAVQLSAEDAALTADQKLQKAQQLVSNNAYEMARAKINSQVQECTNTMLDQTQNRQNRASSVFTDMYHKLEAGIIVLVILMLMLCIMVHRLIVVPLMKCEQSIQNNATFPVVGADEMQMLAETYNEMYLSNKEAQELIRHKAEHDALTDLLNRGSFEKLLHVYETGEAPFALIIVDVDSFKTINDTYGHSVGDEALKLVSSLLLQAFRSIDYVCRIGGDEFAVIMVEMTSDLQYTIHEKINAVNERLAQPQDGLPKLSLSVGVAFTDRKNPSGSLFQDADKALYVRKKNGKAGCTVYEG